MGHLVSSKHHPNICWRILPKGGHLFHAIEEREGGEGAPRVSGDLALIPVFVMFAWDLGDPPLAVVLDSDLHSLLNPKNADPAAS